MPVLAQERHRRSTLKITVVGLGYVGLVTAASFAAVGHEVVGVDSSASRIASLRLGLAPFYDPGLQELLDQVLASRSLVVDPGLSGHIAGSDAIFICVGTPMAATGEADLSALDAVVSRLGEEMLGSETVVIKSTVPVGTNDLVVESLGRTIRERGIDLPVSVVSNPEFLREGSAVFDVFHPDRVVVGSSNSGGFAFMRDLYAPFKYDCRFFEVSPRTAEMAKYASNAFLAAKISFINEISRLCEVLHTRVDDVADIMGADPRIGPSFLRAGIGFGGSCFPKDVGALVAMFQSEGLASPMLEAVAQVNLTQRMRFADRIIAQFDGSLEGCNLGVWGLTFKPETDDIREAPSIDIIERLLEAGAQLRVYDPALSEGGLVLMSNPNVVVANSAVEAIKGADALIALTEWREFVDFDLTELRRHLSGGLVFDGRNMFDEKLVANAGLQYFGVGR